MGDFLRRLIYPLVLPTIVACVWAHAWAMRREPEYLPMSAALPAPLSDHGEAPIVHVPSPGYGFASDDDGLASADADAE